MFLAYISATLYRPNRQLGVVPLKGLKEVYQGMTRQGKTDDD
jgi:hypothetical protein